MFLQNTFFYRTPPVAAYRCTIERFCKLKRCSSTIVFRGHLWNFSELLFYRTTLDDWFSKISLLLTSADNDDTIVNCSVEQLIVSTDNCVNRQNHAKPYFLSVNIIFEGPYHQNPPACQKQIFNQSRTLIQTLFGEVERQWSLLNRDARCFIALLAKQLII